MSLTHRPLSRCRTRGDFVLRVHDIYTYFILYLFCIIDNYTGLV